MGSPDRRWLIDGITRQPKHEIDGPQRQRLGHADGWHRILEPQLQRNRLALATRRHAGRSGRAAVRCARPRHRPDRPAAFLDVGSAECLRNEILAYAGRIWQADGEAELHVWPGGIHAFDREVPEARISKAAVAARHNWLERLLAAI